MKIRNVFFERLSDTLLIRRIPNARTGMIEKSPILNTFIAVPSTKRMTFDSRKYIRKPKTK